MFARDEPRRTRVPRDAHRLGLAARCAARGRHHRAPPHPALPAAPHPRVRALRRLLRRVQLRCRGHSRTAAGPACRATRRSRPGRPLRLQKLVHFGTPVMRSGDRSEYRALPSQLKSLLSQLEPHDLCDSPMRTSCACTCSLSSSCNCSGSSFRSSRSTRSWAPTPAPTHPLRSNSRLRRVRVLHSTWARTRAVGRRCCAGRCRTLRRSRTTRSALSGGSSRSSRVFCTRCCGACTSGASAASWDAARCASRQTTRTRTAARLSRSSRSPRLLRTCKRPIAQAKRLSPRQRINVLIS